MFSVGFLVQVILATAAFAIPSNKERLSERVARRGAAHQSKPLNRITPQVNTDVELSSNDVISSNWGGAVLVADEATYKSVTGTFTIPDFKSDGDPFLECMAVWVGIDGDTCPSAILQTGLDLCVSNDQVTLFFTAWYEFFPLAPVDFADMSFSVGDSITLTATVSTTQSGTLVITNNSQNVTVTQEVTSPSASLCQVNAEWIIEDYTSGHIPNFETVLFTSASATTLDGVKVTPGSGNISIIDLELFSDIFTNTSVSEDTVTIKYQEPLGAF